MIDKGTGPENPDLSRELLWAISAEMGAAEVDFTVLVGRDLSDLKCILRGERIPNVPFDKKRAINTLTRSERSAETTEILAGILSSADEPTEVRVTAARNIALMPLDICEKALLRNLTDRDKFVREEVIRSLSRIGTTEALRRLQELPVPDNEYHQRQLSFAKLSIGIRSDTEETDISGILGIRWASHRVKPIEGKAVKEDIDSIWGSPYGITLNPDLGFDVHCGRLRHLLFLNAEIKRGALVSSVRSRAMIAGVVALQEEDVKYSTIRYLLLTVPSETGIDAIIARTNGEVAYTGEARFDGEVLRLEMRDVGLERTPTEIEGLVSNDDVNVNLRIWRGAIRTKKHGEPIHV